jgi:hypothetical protein
MKYVYENVKYDVVRQFVTHLLIHKGRDDLGQMKAKQMQ